MFPFRLFAATGDVVARLDSVDGVSVQTTIVLGNELQSREGHKVLKTSSGRGQSWSATRFASK
jgi:hypothetical protein